MNLDKKTNIKNNFEKNIKLFDEKITSKICFNIDNTKNTFINNSNTINNSTKDNTINNNSNDSNNVNNKNININKIDNNIKLIGNFINMPIFPSSFNDKNEILNKNKKMITNEIIDKKISFNQFLNIDESINPNKSFSNAKFDDFINPKEPTIITNPNKTFLSDYNQAVNRLLCQRLNQFSMFSSLQNNSYINPISNNFNNMMKFNQINDNNKFFSDRNNLSEKKL